MHSASVSAADRETVLARPPSNSVDSAGSHVRRRGPRSTAACERRSRGRASFSGSSPVEVWRRHDRESRAQHVHHDESPQGTSRNVHFASGAAEQSGFTALPLDISTKFRLFHLNVNGLDAHLALLDALLAQHFFAEFVAITETHLDKSIEALKLSNYELVSRRDRPDQRGWGGIALYARWDVHQNIVRTRDSDTLELAWHTLHSDVGPLLLGVWYRPPRRGDTSTIEAFDKELEEFQDFVGRIVIGDMNVHNEHWLRFSNGESPEGSELESVCAAHGLKQHVKEPTRGDHLLDLALSDLGPGIRSSVHPGVLDSDHCCVICDIDISIPVSSPSARECFDFGKAKWNDLRRALKEHEWSPMFSENNPDKSASDLTEFLLATAKRFIPTKTVRVKPYKHPWIDESCRRLLREKHDAIGTPEFPAARDRCTAGFRDAQVRFLISTKEKLKKSGSKDWWKLSRDLLGKTTGKDNVPPLRDDDIWVKYPASKATLLSTIFSSKSKLPNPVSNEFSAVEPPTASLDRFLRIRVRDVLKNLKALDVSSATGPDALPAVILQKCAAELALPIALLSRLCLNRGRWPACWRQHWIHPLHKRKSKADPRNYRGVHLTPQLAKVVERTIGQTFVPWLGDNAFGEHQYAYCAGKSHRDVLAVNVCSWILLLEDGHTVGLYCRDVSGAFDRVDRERMPLKLRSSGLPQCAVAFPESWLEDRVSCVVVSGAKSVEETLANSVFQGTVLGPPLWNVFYADARHAVRELGYIETIFADDFNCWKGFRNTERRSLPVELRHEIESRGAQQDLHKWGAANRVIFDPSKEEFILIRRRNALGNPFKLLGLVFDPQLLMRIGARKIATEAGWRLQSILRARRYYSIPELMRLYKANVLSFIESGVAGYFHAAPSTLECIDRVQRRFLRRIGLTDEQALLDFRLAPLKVRREIGILGFLHRVILGQISGQISELFPRAIPRSSSGWISGRIQGARRHDKQLLDRITAESSDQMKRSIFGMVQCYNALPQHVVDSPSGKCFQRQLQQALVTRVREGYDGWRSVFSDGRRYASMLRFQAIFQ